MSNIGLAPLAWLHHREPPIVGVVQGNTRDVGADRRRDHFMAIASGT
jgi:hypothetical protein